MTILNSTFGMFYSWNSFIIILHYSTSKYIFQMIYLYFAIIKIPSLGHSDIHNIFDKYVLSIGEQTESSKVTVLFYTISLGLLAQINNLWITTLRVKYRLNVGQQLWYCNVLYYIFIFC